MPPSRLLARSPASAKSRIRQRALLSLRHGRPQSSSRRLRTLFCDADHPRLICEEKSVERRALAQQPARRFLLRSAQAMRYIRRDSAENCARAIIGCGKFCRPRSIAVPLFCRDSAAKPSATGHPQSFSAWRVFGLGLYRRLVCSQRNRHRAAALSVSRSGRAVRALRTIVWSKLSPEIAG
jgi:hypothetical protein